MNLDQIIDKRTVAIPGPIGKPDPQGNQGIPGVTAVPADEAVAAYISTADTKTASALTTWRPPVNVVDAGVDNTGQKDVSAAIQALADTSVAGLYFPAGIYLVSKSIDLPYNTTVPWQIQMEPGAIIRATAAMEQVFNLGVENQSGSINELQTVHGGIIDCNYSASAAIRTSSKITSVVFSDVTIINTLDYGIYQERPDVSFSLDSRYTNVRVNYVHGPSAQGADSDTVAFYLGGSDVQMSDIYVSRVQVGIAAEGFFQISNSHLFTWGSTPPTVGIRAAGGIHATNLYLDGFQLGITDQRTNGAWNDGAVSGLVLNNYFFYIYDGSPRTDDGLTPIKIRQNTPLTLLAHEFRYGSSTARNGIVSYDDPITGKATLRPSPYGRMILPMRPNLFVPKDDVESLLAASTRGWLQVISPQNVPQGAGFLIGYAIYDSGMISMQSGITIYEDNAYTCARIWMVLSLSAAGVSGNIKVVEAISPSPSKRIAIGKLIQLRDGLQGAPIFLYNTGGAGYWDGIYVDQWTPNYRQPTYFNMGVAPSAIDTSQIVQSAALS